MSRDIDLTKVKKRDLIIIIGFAIKIINICGFDIYVSLDNHNNLKFKLKDLSRINLENIEEEFFPTFSSCFHRLSPIYLKYFNKKLEEKNISNTSNFEQLAIDFYEDEAIANIMQNIYGTKKNNFLYLPNKQIITRTSVLNIKDEYILEYVNNAFDIYTTLKEYTLDPDCIIFNEFKNDIKITQDEKSKALICINNINKNQKENTIWIFGKKQEVQEYLSNLRDKTYELYIKRLLKEGIEFIREYTLEIENMIYNVETLKDNIVCIKSKKDAFQICTKEETKVNLIKILDEVNNFYSKGSE